MYQPVKINVLFADYFFAIVGWGKAGQITKLPRQAMRLLLIHPVITQPAVWYFTFQRP
jgi:hypothetical protein